MRCAPFGIQSMTNDCGAPCSSNSSSGRYERIHASSMGEVLGVGAHFGERHLMRAPRAFDGKAVDERGPGPPLGRPQHDHRPARAGPRRPTRAPRVAVAGSRPARVERRGELLVDERRVVAGDEVGRPPVPFEEARQLVVADAREHRGVGDLVPVEVQDRQHRAVARRDRGTCSSASSSRADRSRPRRHRRRTRRRGRGCRTRRRTRGSASSRARRLRGSSRGSRVRRDWARHRERELPEQPGHPPLVARDVAVHLGVRAFEPAVARAIAGPP